MSKVNKKIEYEFLPEALEITESPSSPAGRAIVWIITSILIFGLVWAYVGRIDEVASARGKVVPVGDVKTIQSQGGGSVSSVKVKNGDKVKKGQPLIELDAQDQTTDLESLRKELATARLERDLMKAAIGGYSLQAVTANYELSDDIKQDLVSLTQSIVSQHQARETALAAVISQYESKLVAENAELHKLKDKSISSNVNDISYPSEQNQIKLQSDKVSDVETRLSQARSDLTSARHDKSTSLMSTVVEHDKNISLIESRINKAENVVGHQSIESPVDGTVANVKVATEGAVIAPAQVLMEVVPHGTPLVIEAFLPNKDIGYVSAGQEVSIKFDTFSFQKHGIIKGKVDNVSANSIDNKDQGSVYPMKVTYADKSMKVNGKEVNIIPGMTVTAEIKTKSRRVIDFFLDPLIKNVDESLKVR